MNRWTIIWICCLMMPLLWACEDEESVEGKNLEAGFGTSYLQTLENITPLQLPVVLSAPAKEEVAVTIFVKKEENAKEGKDYTFMTKQVVIPVGKSIAWFEVEVKDYPKLTPKRTFEVEIVNVKGARSGKPDVCRVEILSNEGFPEIGFVEGMKTVGEDEGETSLKVELNRLGNEVVNFRVRPVAGGTALLDKHFRIDTLQLYSITPGDTLAEVKVEIINDLEVNEDRWVELELFDVEQAEVSEVYGRMKLTFKNEDQRVFVKFSRIIGEAPEGETMWLPVRIEGVHQRPVKVTLEVASGGTAVEGTDYVMEKKELVLPVGVWEDSVKITCLDNDVKDLDRNFFIRIATLENAECASLDTLATLWVRNDDFDLKELYDNLMGEWILYQEGDPKDNNFKSPLEAEVIILGGDTPEDEDDNYLKRLVCRAKGYVWSTDFTFRLNYDVNTGNMSLILKETVMTYNFGGDFGNCNMKLESEDANETEYEVIPSKDYKILTFKPGIIKAQLYDFDTDERLAPYHFRLLNARLVRKQ